MAGQTRDRRERLLRKREARRQKRDRLASANQDVFPPADPARAAERMGELWDLTWQTRLLSNLLGDMRAFL
jgi:hypothetical protein